ncbi:PREDICTED: uncharacterized protein LOC109463950 isoform X2 [Branchiostoma belcheri]|uniref:Uncharacterized protein LOC109463950 isoform X1 n=1 Tax=Branchiostoma belcheri TaxID=7741 RepID=A0A6P4Y1N4_BRABE|nr:PREDICTED: uncharacterized protein LOC109463950 isoform X1 [Branchiostoma belcheri]XP_019616424.1 PREDICTED: uncharacterized protein LOC109463950 isoform X2 [Branchiostoma belcheri]
MGKRNRGSSGSSVGENSPSQQNPPPKTLKMAANPPEDVSEVSLNSLPQELQTLAQLIMTQVKKQQDTVVKEFNTVGDKLSSQIQTLDSKVDSLTTDMAALRERVRELENTVEFQDSEMKRLNDSLLAERRERIRTSLLAERYSMKADVVIRGIPYNKEENCRQVLENFLADELGLDSMPIVAVHRLSRPTTSRPNPP